MTNPTLAQRQAAFLRALADLLDARPHLAPVNVTSSWENDPNRRLAGNPSLQIATRVGAPCSAADVQAWAAAIGATQLRVNLVNGDEGYLRADGHLGGTALDVWGAVRGDYSGGDEIPVRGDE